MLFITQLLKELIVLAILFGIVRLLFCMLVPRFIRRGFSRSAKKLYKINKVFYVKGKKYATEKYNEYKEYKEDKKVHCDYEDLDEGEGFIYNEHPDVVFVKFPNAQNIPKKLKQRAEKK